MSDLICIHTYPNRTSADVARGILEANGIHCTVSAADAGYDISFATGGAKLLVVQTDYEKAQQLLAGGSSTLSGDGSSNSELCTEGIPKPETRTPRQKRIVVWTAMILLGIALIVFASGTFFKLLPW
jgi:hypothetical protein